MTKSVHTREYDAFRRLLRQARERAGVTQVELAKRLKVTQSQVSKCERGEVRLDLVQLRAHCQALGVTLSDFVGEFEGEIRARRR